MRGLAIARPRANVAAIAATIGLGAVAWVVSLRLMDGMDMGSATELGSAASFAGVWVAMMAAMMLPGVVPAALGVARAGLMAMFLALGVMSVAWMAVVTVAVAAQKLLAPRAAIDVPVALAIVTLGLIVTV